MKIRFLLLMMTGILVFSCQSVPKNIGYFQDFETYSQNDSSFYSAYEPTIRTNDELMITVSAPVFDQTQVAQFNLPMNTYLGNEGSVQSMSMQTYRVDKNGCINFPVIGQIKVEGLTRSETVTLLSEKISPYLPEPIINLQIASFRVTVLGEVNRPGNINVTNERITVLDALGIAGDLTIYGNRENVKLIRDNNGKKEFYTYDLTRSDLFLSPYYYLQQNDVIYIEPNDTRKKASKFGSAENFTLSIMSLGFTAISVLVTVISLIAK
ncbi:MAG: polysaccharide biosynthesis/export family protein [Cytophagaceae bacterium]|jgi:polysaccharide export outer membrane protein|nr:polysaccharide biosynthesis/export family protein [Cytophagaceae bacterium]